VKSLPRAFNEAEVRKHNVSVNEQWFSDFTSETVPFITSEADLALAEGQLAIQQEDVRSKHITMRIQKKKTEILEDKKLSLRITRHTM